MKLSSLLLALLACTSVAAPVYLTGDASYVVEAGPADTVWVQHNSENVTAFPGDSICVHFQANGHIETFFVSSNYIAVTTFLWLPAERYPGVLFLLSGFGMLTSVQPRRC